MLQGRLTMWTSRLGCASIRHAPQSSRLDPLVGANETIVNNGTIGSAIMCNVKKTVRYNTFYSIIDQLRRYHFKNRRNRTILNCGEVIKTSHSLPWFLLSYYSSNISCIISETKERTWFLTARSLRALGLLSTWISSLMTSTFVFHWMVKKTQKKSNNDPDQNEDYDNQESNGAAVPPPPSLSNWKFKRVAKLELTCHVFPWPLPSYCHGLKNLVEPERVMTHGDPWNGRGKSVKWKRTLHEWNQFSCFEMLHYTLFCLTQPQQVVPACIRKIDTSLTFCDPQFWGDLYNKLHVLLSKKSDKMWRTMRSANRPRTHERKWDEQEGLKTHFPTRLGG